MIMNPALSKDLFAFLTRLENNNNREWFNDHKPQFKRLEADVKSFYNELGVLLNKHDQIDKIKVFRIYRDVRFSKNKLPYKTHFGGAFHRLKPQLRGGYYLHIQPKDQSFIAAGFWEPSKEDLFRIRKEFEIDDSEIREVLADRQFEQIWGGFVGEELKTAPKGFSKDHKAIDLIRRKQFIFTRAFTDREVLDHSFILEVDKSFRLVRPFFDLMSDVLTTDLNGESLI
jgi:uncharacterized protein (TIGR02453 family)